MLGRFLNTRPVQSAFVCCEFQERWVELYKCVLHCGIRAVAGIARGGGWEGRGFIDATKAEVCVVISEANLASIRLALRRACAPSAECRRLTEAHFGRQGAICVAALQTVRR